MNVVAHLPIKEALRQSFRISEGASVKVNGQRFNVFGLRTFAMHGCKCSRCGKVGNNLVAWKDKGDSLHVDLFHKTESGKFILMNRDHIIPKSKRGANSEWNYQTMCVTCNLKKGNNETDEDKELAKFREKWKKIHMAIHKKYWNHLPKWMRRGTMAKILVKLRERYTHKVSYVMALISP
jgi:5-methylcytosine-specific restriction endonuclease McrA